MKITAISDKDGVRDRTLSAIKSVVGQFITATDNPWLHEITASVVESFLRDLWAKNQSDKATKKTWNNYRNDLNDLNDLNGFLSSRENELVNLKTRPCSKMQRGESTCNAMK